MPAIVTHYCFGEDALDILPRVCGDSRDECDAFLLGNQGPDPLFFLPGPAPFGTISLARQMHSEKPAELLAALKQALDTLREDEQVIGRAYAHGFLCHYLLDSTVHPLVYSLVYRICDAEVEGLTRDDRKTVHDYIEREWDEMAMTVKLDTTVAHFRPVVALRASETVLNIVQKMYTFMALATYGRVIETESFLRAVAAYRLEQRLILSKSGLKRAALGRFEELITRHSRVRAITPRPIRVESTWLANPHNDEWEDPFTGQVHTQSFWDLYHEALQRVEETIDTFDATSFDKETARALTDEKNFRGQPVVVTLTVHKD